MLVEPFAYGFIRIHTEENGNIKRNEDFSEPEGSLVCLCILESAHDDKLFYGTAEVIESNPLPKRLRIVDAMYSDVPEEAQETGEILQVSHVEKHGNIKVCCTYRAYCFKANLKRNTCFSWLKYIISS